MKLAAPQWKFNNIHHIHVQGNSKLFSIIASGYPTGMDYETKII